MTDLENKHQPNLSARALAEKQARERRRAEALRANLRRRKEHEPARGAGAAKDDGADG